MNRNKTIGSVSYRHVHKNSLDATAKLFALSLFYYAYHYELVRYI